MKMFKFYLLLLMLLGASSTFAQASYPNKSISLIVPFAPGGNTDLLARVIAQRLSESFGQPVVIENKPGAGGTIGLGIVAKSKPDGYTLGLGSFGNVLVANSLYKNLSYEPAKNLSPVILLSTPPTVLVAPSKLGITDVTSLIQYAKSNPGAIHYGSSGNGTSNHLFGELFASQANIKMIHVPYKGSSPAINDLLAGITQLNFAPFPLVLQHIKSGALTAIAVTGEKRSNLLPHIPTVNESGLKGYFANGWFAVVVPNTTPRNITVKLNYEINQILLLQEVKKNLEGEGADPIGGSIEDATKSIDQGIRKWNSLVNRLDLKID